MATMVKEKRKEKKRTKDKSATKANRFLEEPPDIVCSKTEIETTGITVSSEAASSIAQERTHIKSGENHPYSIETEVHEKSKLIVNNNNFGIGSAKQKFIINEEHTFVFNDLKAKLERISVPSEIRNISEEEMNRLETPSAYLEPHLENSSVTCEENVELATPSAPILIEVKESPKVQEAVAPAKVIPKIQCMSLEEAISFYGGEEMVEVRELSEKEEMIVEAGFTKPEHPLDDLLSTFRCSLMAMERERANIAQNLDKAKKIRSSLWKIEKKYINKTLKCPCGLNVMFNASYDHAELQKEKLTVAKMRLENLLRDVQESYCHHQHTALIAYHQIKEFIFIIAQSTKGEIREALSLVLQALRVSDTAPNVYASVLQRWASSLAAALVDGRDLRQTLFLLHHMFRQSRSIRWATRFIKVSVGDRVEAARAIALLDLILVGPRTTSALECVEEAEELWEEVDVRGSGAVSEGSLRERDLIALLQALPLRNLIASLALFTHRDVSTASEHEWSLCDGGAGVYRSACGVRALCAVVRGAGAAHARYSRLRRRLHTLATHALYVLAQLHLHNKDSYLKDLEDKIMAELEACFVFGSQILDSKELPQLPGALLRNETARQYCEAFTEQLHDRSDVTFYIKKIECLSMEIPALDCSLRIRIVTQMAVDRVHDHHLATSILDFLLMMGLKRKFASCIGQCDVDARKCVPRVLRAHPYLYTIAFQVAVDICRVDIETYSRRPNSAEARTVFDEWSVRCKHLLDQFDYTPHGGLSLDTQLIIGSWLCGLHTTFPGDNLEWTWAELRRLQVHRTSWNTNLDTPTPQEEPKDLFQTAYFVLSSSWGHSIPLICEYGVPALCRLATVRPRDAVHCLGPVMLVMSHSPESVSLTPKFKELFSTLLESGPTLVQRALGRGGDTGSTLLLNLILAQLGNRNATYGRGGVLGAWLHALWRSASDAALSLIDAASLACREWSTLDAFVNGLMQEEKSRDHLSLCVRAASVAPLLCESALRAAHAQAELHTHLLARLSHELLQQHLAKQKIHVDNALKKINAQISSDDLVIYKCGAVVTAVSPRHPSHIALLRTFLHLYLQPLTANIHDMTPAGPLLFSGLIKSRLLNQIKKRLQEITLYHHNEAEALKSKISTEKKSEEPKIPEQAAANISDEENGDVIQKSSRADLLGESDSSDSDSESTEEDNKNEIDKNRQENRAISEENQVDKLLCYHVAAERLVGEYLKWLDAGELVRVSPHLADIARFIPDQVMTAAWEREVNRLRSGDEPLPLKPPPSSPDTPQTPFHNAVKRILSIKDRTYKRKSTKQSTSLTANIDFKNTRCVLSAIDNHLKKMDELAREWLSETSRISSLDSKLWQLVAVLRVPKALPVISRTCSRKCRPLTYRIQDQEWCISSGAEREIRENRKAARAALRRMSRARPHAARTAAALLAIARGIRRVDAESVVQRAWRCAGEAVERCPLAAQAVSALVHYLADKWLCEEGALCGELVRGWSAARGSAMQVELCGALVSPRRLPPPARAILYSALLRASLPDHMLFSHLSKFELTQWANQCEPDKRRELLYGLAEVAQRWGPTPKDEHSVLLELVGIHSSILTNASELASQVTAYSRASATARLPAAQWTHLLAAVDGHASLLSCDQLGHLLREVGLIWWEARSSGATGGPLYAQYAPHVASLCHKLQRAFVAAAVALSYDANRVAWIAWSTLVESWSPWVSPRVGAAPLLVLDSAPAADMLKHFLDNAHQVILDCPGCEEEFLLRVFEWTVHTYLSLKWTDAEQYCRIQLSALLAELRKLPWSEHHWLNVDTVHLLLQISGSGDKEMIEWCCSCVLATRSERWTRVPDAHVAPHLAVLLHLFTSLPLGARTLEEGKHFPWSRLPLVALETALERFFADHHNPSVAYHELPQFCMVLAASELLPSQSPSHDSALSRQRRICGVSHWTRAACSPALAHHVPAYSQCVLNTLTELASNLEESSGELEELLSRAVLVMCMDPASSAALPVWERWLSSTQTRMASACASAAANLTVLETCAALLDHAARSILRSTDSSGWSSLCARLEACPWREAGPLAARGRLHAAYAILLTHTHTDHALRSVFLALLAAELDFTANEVMLCVWCCCAFRLAGGAGSAGSAESRAVLVRWAADTRRSLVQLVSLRTPTDTPTNKLRLLSRLALCTLTPSEAAARAYEATCATVFGSNPGEVIKWGAAPHTSHLPRLAMLLFPESEKYFAEELRMSPE